MAELRVRVPSTARQGEVIEIKTLLSHPMETGHRRDVYGKLIPRQIIHTFTCTYNGTEPGRPSAPRIACLPGAIPPCGLNPILSAQTNM